MGPSLPGTFLAFAATVLLIFTCVTPPTWNSVYFLRAGEQDVHYGVFGYNDYGPTLGYDVDANQFNDIGTPLLYNLTVAMILHPIAAGLAGIACLCGLSNARIGTVFMTISSALATLVTLVAWVLDMVLWGVVRNRFHDRGIGAVFGNALWITLGALVALMIGFCASACGIFGRYRKRARA